MMSEIGGNVHLHAMLVAMGNILDKERTIEIVKG